MASIKGMASLVTQLKNIRKDTEAAARRGILKTAKLIEADAKAKVPKDKGLLEASIGIEQKENTTFIFAGAKYAPYQEFGTGPLTEAPKGYEAYAKEFIVTGKGHTPPRPFLFPAFFKYQGTVMTNVEEEIDKILK